MKSICVFCGSGTGTKPVYSEKAGELGNLIGSGGMGLVYGGSNIGLMGIVSAAARDSGAAVTGVIPERIAANVPPQDGITVEVVPGMHERKTRMYELSDAFVAMPGGIGTLEELFEAWTWSQLGYHSKAVAVLNVEGYFDSLLTFLDRASHDGFLTSSQRKSLVVADTINDLFEGLNRWTPPKGLKWD